MKNKRKLVLGTSILVFMISMTTFSCVYGTNNFFYKANQVKNRVDYIHELDDFETDIKSESINEKKYKILVLTDVHLGNRVKKVEMERFFSWLDTCKTNNDLPEFCLILGDNVDHGYKKEYDTYCDFTKHIKDKGIPVITMFGNHDLYNSGWDNFKKMCYPHCSLFHYDTPGFSWYGIDTGTGNIGKKQFDLLKNAFAKDKKPKIVISHYPLTNSRTVGAISFHDSTERNLLIDLYAKNNVKAVLCGHLHKTKYKDLGAFKEYGFPSFCYAKYPAWTLLEINETNPNVPELKLLPRKF